MKIKNIFFGITFFIAVFCGIEAGAVEIEHCRCNFYENYDGENRHNLAFDGIKRGSITAETVLRGKTNGKAEICAAVYKEGRLTELKWKEADLQANKDVVSTADFDVADTDAEIKVFVWENKNPITKVHTLSKAGSEYSNLSFDRKKISEIAEDVQDGFMKELYNAMKNAASFSAASSYEFPESAIGGRQFQIAVLYSALCGYVEENSEYIRQSIGRMVKTAEETDVKLMNSLNNALCVGDTLMAYAVGYEWTKDFMTETEKSLLNSEIEEYAEWLYTNSSTQAWGEDSEKRKAWNWNAVAHGPLGMAAATLSGHEEWMERAALRCREYLIYSKDESGFYHEGGSYGGYGMHNAIPFVIMYKNLKGEDLSLSSPSLPYMCDYLIHQTYPGGKGMPSINQSTGLLPADGVMYYIVKNQSKEGLWTWQQTYGANGDVTYGQGWQGNGGSIAFTLLYYDNNLEVQKPGEYFPVEKLYANGAITARSSWNDMAAHFTFTIGERYASIWNHADAGSITYSAYGENFVVDKGAGAVISSQHSLIQIDGYAQDKGTRSGNYNSKLVSKTVTDDYIAAEADLTESYKKAHKNVTASRQILMRKGDIPYLVIYDNIVKSGGSHKYTSRFVMDSNNTFSILSGNRVRITGSQRGGKCLVSVMPQDGISVTITDDEYLDIEKTDETGDFLYIFCPYDAGMRTPAVTYTQTEDGCIAVISFGAYEETVRLKDGKLIYG